MKKVTIYTDGACSNNPGKGGWGVVLIYNEKKKELSGFEDNTTNNRMELTAAIKGLKALKEPCKVDLYSDSAYLINAFNEGWVFSWQEKNWKNAKKKDVLNKDLWLEIIDLISKHQVNWIKVKGHADNEFNNRCDELARKEIEAH